MTASFATDLRRGEAAEADLDSFFRARGYHIEPATADEQRRGIDRWFIPGEGQALVSVEYKADSRAHETGNAFIETVSVAERGVRGWAYTSQAAWLFYALPLDGLVYRIRFTDLRARLPRWERRCRRVTVRNSDYTTEGLLVPLLELERLSGRRTVQMG